MKISELKSDMYPYNPDLKVMVEVYIDDEQVLVEANGAFLSGIEVPPKGNIAFKKGDQTFPVLVIRAPKPNDGLDHD